MTPVTVCFGNYRRATACCKVFRNKIMNAESLFPVLTYTFTSHMLLIAEMEKLPLQ